jgi:hypothetical protein
MLLSPDAMFNTCTHALDKDPCPSVAVTTLEAICDVNTETTRSSVRALAHVLDKASHVPQFAIAKDVSISTAIVQHSTPCHGHVAAAQSCA